MDKHALIMHELLDLAQRLGIRIRREKLGTEEVPACSGLAWIDGRPVLFLDRGLPAVEAVDVLISELSAFPLEDVYVKPGIRALLDSSPEGDDAKPE